MKTVKVLQGQTLVDIAIQELGDTGRVLEIAELNEITVTTVLAAGQLIKVPDYDTANRSTVNVFTDDANKPASGISNTEDELIIPLEGIDYWAIESDFVVQ